MDNTNEQEDKVVDMILMKPMNDNENVEEGFEDIDSQLIGRPLFVVNLDLEPNQEVMECFSDKRIKERRQLDPIILSFLDDEKDNKNHPLYGQTWIEIFTE